ncbi:hypothetical protein RLPCCGM1_p0024 [Rhizobium leguminosarum bv. phaseoli CCGM1]|nr:hypothetical protein RLPCCGM1_p0024 [Rhizobium leguminosarum bv. phaseoli CCGM1]
MADYGDREKATAIAALIAGPESVETMLADERREADRGGRGRLRQAASQQFPHSTRGQRR